MSKPQNRRRSSSIRDALRQVPLNRQTDLSSGRLSPSTPSPTTAGVNPGGSEVWPLPAGKPRRNPDALPKLYNSRGFLKDLQTGRWMLVPSSAFKLMVIGAAIYYATELGLRTFAPGTPNPFRYCLFLQYQQPDGTYLKGWGDFVFVIYHVIFWSFMRQAVTIHILRPMAISLGIKGEKIMRFTEQGYAVFYFSITSVCGIYVMRGLPTWWYKTEHFWLEYPHRQMPFFLKLYYLLQASYWLQQTIILAGRIEKPRKDFKELVAHHIVTLWLVGWSYAIHLTYIGVSIFLTMDFSDIFLALAKCVNYVSETASAPIFAVFVCIWTYFRHYLNIIILYSVYTQFDLIPAKEMVFAPFKTDQWMTWWMKWQIFVPIFLLQLINAFWYVLIWRILIRALRGSLKDERSDDEESEGEDEAAVKTKAKAKGSKAQ